METPKDSILAQLQAAAPGARFITDRAAMHPFLADWRGRFEGASLAVVEPRSTAEVSAVLETAFRCGVAVVPQGGNTGLCGGATPPSDRASIVLRLARMDRVRDLDPLGNTMTVEAGCILRNAQEAAASVDRLLPMSLGSEGSCQIGGTISTNAGGTSVLRYGTMRELVLGIEAVLPDGRVFDGLKALRKNNTGYDMKQIFIGAEGTLGIVTAAVLKLFARPKASATAMAAIPSVAAALELLARLRDACGDRLSQYEIMSDAEVAIVEREMERARLPLETRSPWYQIIELADARTGADLVSSLESALAEAMERGLVTDAVVASSEAQAEAIWRLRHSVSESHKKAGVSVSHDTSVPLKALPRFVAQTERRIRERFPDAQCLYVGHVGDGNIHCIALFPKGRFASAAAFEEVAAAVNDIVYGIAAELGGSISAEHGIGSTLREKLPRYKSAVELDLMRTLKRTLDPMGLMNPGKVL